MTDEFVRCVGRAVFGRAGRVYVGRYEWKEALDDCVDRWDESSIEVELTPAEAMRFAKAVLDKDYVEVPDDPAPDEDGLVPVDERPSIRIFQDEYGPCITWMDKDVWVHDEGQGIDTALAEDIVRTVENMGGHQ